MQLQILEKDTRYQNAQSRNQLLAIQLLPLLVEDPFRTAQSCIPFLRDSGVTHTNQIWDAFSLTRKLLNLKKGRSFASEEEYEAFAESARKLGFAPASMRVANKSVQVMGFPKKVEVQPATPSLNVAEKNVTEKTPDLSLRIAELEREIETLRKGSGLVGQKVAVLYSANTATLEAWVRAVRGWANTDKVSWAFEEGQAVVRATGTEEERVRILEACTYLLPAFPAGKVG